MEWSSDYRTTSTSDGAHNMTDILCYQDSYLKTFDATVTAVTNRGVVLDRTAFYPGGGGQPTDSGTLAADGMEYAVKRIRRESGQYVHEIDGDEYPEVGAQISGEVDWDRRYQLIRQRFRIPRAMEHPHRAAHSLRSRLAGLRSAGHGRQHGAAQGQDGLRVRKHVRRFR